LIDWYQQRQRHTRAHPPAFFFIFNKGTSIYFYFDNRVPSYIIGANLASCLGSPWVMLHEWNTKGVFYNNDLTC
jgi:hypothetical protein